VTDSVVLISIKSLKKVIVQITRSPFDMNSKFCIAVRCAKDLKHSDSDMLLLYTVSVNK